MRISALVLFLVFIYTTTPALSEIYRWVDKNGNVSFSDTPPEGPSEVVDLEPITTFKSSVLPKIEPENSSNTDRQQPPEATFSKRNKVDLYVTDWCPYCKKAEAFFAARNIEVSIYNIEKDRKAFKRKQSLDGSNGVPFAVINGEKIHGFNETLYLKALKN